MSLEGPAFSAVLESANGMEAQPARVDAAVINNLPPRIQADFAFGAIGIPNSSFHIHLAPLYGIVRLEVKSIHGRWDPDLAQRKTQTSASRLPEVHEKPAALLPRYTPPLPAFGSRFGSRLDLTRFSGQFLTSLS